MIVELTGVTKVYDGRAVLDGLDLAVPEGDVFGFLGVNGAGKTTTIRLLLGLARPTSGSVRLFGEPPSAPGRARIGYAPDVPAFPTWMRARDVLRFSGELFGLDRATLARRSDVLLDLAGLTDVTQRVGAYSRGMRQRLAIAQALVNAPDLVILDEPTSALDPLGRRDVLDVIARLRGKATVLFSTHILADAERVCDTVAVIDQGRLVAQDATAALRERHGAGHRVLVEVSERADEVAAQLRQEPGVAAVDVAAGVLRIATADPVALGRTVPVVLGRLGVGLRRFESDELSLEDAFVALVGRERAA